MLEVFFILELENDIVFWFGNNFLVLMLELLEFLIFFFLIFEGFVLDFMLIIGISFLVIFIW